MQIKYCKWAFRWLIMSALSFGKSILIALCRKNNHLPLVPYFSLLRVSWLRMKSVSDLVTFQFRSLSHELALFDVMKARWMFIGFKCEGLLVWDRVKRRIWMQKRREMKIKMTCMSSIAAYSDGKWLWLLIPQKSKMSSFVWM